MKLTPEQTQAVLTTADRVYLTREHTGSPLATRGAAYVEFTSSSPNGSYKLRVRDEAPDMVDAWREVTCASWTEALEVTRACLATGRTCVYGPGIGLRDMLPLPAQPPVHEPWETIARAVDGDTNRAEPLTLNADYQRPRVWTEAQQSAFLGWAMTGGEVPVVYCRRTSWDKPTEVVDGKQRVLAIHAFVRGKVPATFLLKGWRTVWWRDLDEVDRRSRSLDLRVSYNEWSRLQTLEFYLKLNSTGVPHAFEELERVRRLLAEEG
jgi:hypothetical protein